MGVSMSTSDEVFIQKLTEHMTKVTPHERVVWDKHHPEHKGHELRKLMAVDTTLRAACMQCKEVLTVTHQQYLVATQQEVFGPGTELVNQDV